MLKSWMTWAWLLMASSTWAGEAPPLKVLVVSLTQERGDGFEALLKEDGLAVGRLAWEELSKDKVKDWDVVLLDPEAGKTNRSGQSQRVERPVPEDLDKPVVAVGAPGSYALIPFLLKFGNNG